jgi:hypothetical protein
VRAVLPLLLLTLFAGCRASMSAQGSADVSGNASGDASGNVDGNESAGAPDATGGEANPDSANGADAYASGADSALLGARHDVRLLTERATTKCQCLAVGLGAANLPAFQWKAAPPNVDAESQLVIALTSEGQSCTAEPKDSLGASYWGYRVLGNDVIVFVEAARKGRPMTLGGIIPKPYAGGQVYVAPASKKTPYGRAADGTARCKIGNPGGERTTPPAAGEQGAAPPDDG